VSPAGGDQSTGPSQRGRRDSATGVHLLPAPAPVTHRIARSSRGPLDPPLRGGAPDASWSRYDVAGRTVYLAETAECAYAEVLAYTKRRLGQQDPLTKDAAAVGLSFAEFNGLVGAEWAERQHMGVGHLPSSWRVERLLYRITLPEAGWWVDIQHPDSLAAAETALEAELATLDLSALTVAVLLGDDRHVTTAVARWVHDLRLEDGSTPAGVAYDSKHGTGRCWACWLPGDASGQHGLTSDDGSPILAIDDDFLRVAQRFRIHVW